jgi:hypothetical protein
MSSPSDGKQIWTMKSRWAFMHILIWPIIFHAYHNYDLLFFTTIIRTVAFHDYHVTGWLLFTTIFTAGMMSLEHKFYFGAVSKRDLTLNTAYGGMLVKQSITPLLHKLIYA